MTNQYRPEQGKVLTILLDCGRMMGVELEGKTKLDLTIESALTLAAVALKQGDQVALLAFSHEIKTYVPPGRGLAHLHTLVEAVYDLQSDFVESNPLQALEYLHRQQKRRSLIVLFSDMENYLLEDQLGAYPGDCGEVICCCCSRWLIRCCMSGAGRRPKTAVWRTSRRWRSASGWTAKRFNKK